MIFTLMGVLCAISASISSARLNSATNALGQFDELYVIAAAVIGGTSLAGGVGHDLRRHARRAGHAVAAVGHGAARLRRGGAADGRRRRARRSPSASTPSTASASSSGGRPWQTQRANPARRDARHLDRLRRHQGRRPRLRRSLSRARWSALLGHNGAGKSTLIKILSGAYKRDAGEIFVNGEEADIGNPRDAKSYGIETIYQTLALGRQCRRRRQPLSRPRAADALGHARRRRDGERRRAR